jgi:hypothetical protein
MRTVGGRDADCGHNRLAFSPQCGTKTDAAANRFLAIRGDSGPARFLKLGEKLLAIDDGVLGARGQSMDLQDALRQLALLERGNDLAYGAAVGGSTRPILLVMRISWKV